MRWLIPAAVLAIGLGVLMWVVPLGKGVALIVPPQTPLVLILAGTLGLVVGVAGTWRSRSSQAGGLADAAAPAGLVLALAAVLALSIVFVVEPILVSLLGPDPCAPSTFLPNHQPDLACFHAHPNYYQPMAGGYGWSTPGSRMSQSLGQFFLAALPLALGAILSSWLALAKGTRRRRTALSALALGSLVIVGMVVIIFGSLLAPGASE